MLPVKRRKNNKNMIGVFCIMWPLLIASLDIWSTAASRPQMMCTVNTFRARDEMSRPKDSSFVDQGLVYIQLRRLTGPYVTFSLALYMLKLKRQQCVCSCGFSAEMYMYCD